MRDNLPVKVLFCVVAGAFIAFIIFKAFGIPIGVNVGGSP